MHVTRRHSQKGIACRQLGNPTDKAFSPGPSFSLFSCASFIPTHPPSRNTTQQHITIYDVLESPNLIFKAYIAFAIVARCCCELGVDYIRRWGEEAGFCSLRWCSACLVVEESTNHQTVVLAALLQSCTSFPCFSEVCGFPKRYLQ